MQVFNSKRRVALRAMFVMSMAALTSGCLPMLAAPIAAGVATTAATNNSAQKTSQYARNVQGMNCRQLRQDYTKLDRDMVARANPWSAWTVKIDAVTETARRKGCRLGCASTQVSRPSNRPIPLIWCSSHPFSENNQE